MPVIEKREAHMLPNHSCFGAIEEEHFREGIRLLSPLEKINSSILRKVFRKDCRRFLKDLVATNLFTVAARSRFGQELSCFCPEIIHGGDDYSVFYLFGQFLDALIEVGLVRGSETEPAKAEFHSFVREQRQVEVSGSRSHVPINGVFAFCNQPGFRSRRILHKVCTILCQINLGFLMIKHVCCFQVFQLTKLVVRGPSEFHPVFNVSLDGVATSHEKVNWTVVCVQDFVRQSLFTQINFVSETGINMLNIAVATADAVPHSSVFDPWGAIGVEAGPVTAYLKSCREKVVLRRKAVKDTRER